GGASELAGDEATNRAGDRGGAWAPGGVRGGPWAVPPNRAPCYSISVLTVEQALQQILERARPLGTERVDLRAALGRVLAEPIVSRRVIPPWPNSSMDGYAVRAGDTTAAPVTLPVVARIQAGAAPDHVLGPGQAMRIFTGAPMPQGGDAVIPQEDVEASNDRVRIARAV